GRSIEVRIARDSVLLAQRPALQRLGGQGSVVLGTIARGLGKPKAASPLVGTTPPRVDDSVVPLFKQHRIDLGTASLYSLNSARKQGNWFRLNGADTASRRHEFTPFHRPARHECRDA